MCERARKRVKLNRKLKDDKFLRSSFPLKDR